ncbi:hypothetical protein MJG53_001287 [Ovis ammon polii x Ovis aries]|uniref:Uncharacterized protein n=1 Tax=Ovis ammon polii x Ovis aries TaxID=2918886 RepID=A0ACB9VKA3_9CETA|nr:hypothetical protein MJG53_001287 [Ovis ammon polii x Ovis aries]
MGLLSLRYHSSLSPQRVPKTPELSPPSPRPSELQLHDVFIVVKTTQAFHHSCQELQLNTGSWLLHQLQTGFEDGPLGQWLPLHGRICPHLVPDDSTVGYIVECKLGSLETLQLLEAAQLPEQVTLSYGIFEGKLNVINLHGPFSPEEGPSRFHSLHCLLYLDTPWCLQLVA